MSGADGRRARINDFRVNGENGRRKMAGFDISIPLAQSNISGHSEGGGPAKEAFCHGAVPPRWPAGQHIG